MTNIPQRSRKTQMNGFGATGTVKQQKSKFTSNFNDNSHNKVYGTHIPTRRGYDNNSRPSPDPASNGWNGMLTNQRGEIIKFWVTEVEANFGITGTYAQSRRKRQFFPHHMNQPRIMVKGITASSGEYNRLAKFVRVAQVYALSERSFQLSDVDYNKIVTTGDGGKPKTYFDPTVRLYIAGGGGPKKRDKHGNIYDTPQGEFMRTKGPHSSWSMSGFIRQMEAGAERHVYAVPFQFEFISLTASGGSLWNDSFVKYRQIRSWMDVFKSRHKGWIEEKQEEKAVDVGKAVANAGEELAKGINNLFG